MKLCREFYRPAACSGARPDGYRGFRSLEGIYFDREHFQTEHILLDGADRARYLPSAVVDTCDRMSQLGLSYRPGQGLTFVRSFSDFLSEIVHKTYQRDTAGLY